MPPVTCGTLLSGQLLSVICQHRAEIFHSIVVTDVLIGHARFIFVFVVADVDCSRHSAFLDAPVTTEASLMATSAEPKQPYNNTDTSSVR